MIYCFFRLKANEQLGEILLLNLAQFVIYWIAIMDNFDRDFNNFIK